MKTKWMSLFAVITLVTITLSCKDEKKHETEATTAEEVKAAPETAVMYHVSDSESSIEWTGSKPAGKHSGTIKLLSGSFEVKSGNIESGSFIIDMTSINVTDLEGDDKAYLEGHLRGEGEGKEDHFFNVAKFPKATFEVTGVSEKEGKTVLAGNLTIKGVEKNISFPVNVSDNGDTYVISSDIFTIDRTQWGVNYGSKSIFENLGDKFINDDIELKISVTAKKA